MAVFGAGQLHRATGLRRACRRTRPRAPTRQVRRQDKKAEERTQVSPLGPHLDEEHWTDPLETASWTQNGQTPSRCHQSVVEKNPQGGLRGLWEKRFPGALHAPVELT